MIRKSHFHLPALQLSRPFQSPPASPPFLFLLPPPLQTAALPPPGTGVPGATRYACLLPAAEAQGAAALPLPAPAQLSRMQTSPVHPAVLAYRGARSGLLGSGYRCTEPCHGLRRWPLSSGKPVGVLRGEEVEASLAEVKPNGCVPCSPLPPAGLAEEHHAALPAGTRRPAGEPGSLCGLLPPALLREGAR